MQTGKNAVCALFWFNIYIILLEIVYKIKYNININFNIDFRGDLFMKKVAIIMGSDSDLPVVTPAIKQLRELGIETEVRVMSAHRTPEEAHEFSKNAIDNGFGVIIAAAGMAAHLGGVLAASTTLPVIGIPCSAKVLDGMDAMLATVMMPPGIPVATVGVNAAKNAALLAAEILSVGDDELMNKLINMRKAMAQQVREKDKALQEKLKEI